MLRQGYKVKMLIIQSDTLLDNVCLLGWCSVQIKSNIDQFYFQNENDFQDYVEKLYENIQISQCCQVETE